MPSQAGIDIEAYKGLVEKTIANSKVSATKGQTSKGTTYTLRNGRATLILTLGDQWIGYELNIDKAELGKAIGTSEDTDNYSLGGENTEVSKEIFNNLLECLEGFLTGGIYVGYVNKKPALAVPLGAERFKMIIRKNLFSGSSEEISGEALMQLSDLRPLLSISNTDKTT